MGDLQPLIGNPYNGYINPYYWVDDHPLLYGNNGSLDPSTYIHPNENLEFSAFCPENTNGTKTPTPGIWVKKTYFTSLQFSYLGKIPQLLHHLPEFTSTRILVGGFKPFEQY